MKILGISPYNNLSYKGTGAAARNQITITPARSYNSDIISLNTKNNPQLPRLPQISKNAKSIHLEGANLYKDMERMRNQVEARIGFGEDELFEDYTIGDTKVSFNFDTQNNQMQMIERDYLNNLVRLSSFDNKGNMKITKYNKYDTISAVIYKGNIEEISLNKKENKDGSSEADKIYTYRNGKLIEAQIGTKVDAEGQRSASELYDFKNLYLGRWDYNQGYQEHEDELTDDEYKTFNSRVAVSTDKKIIAYAKDYLDGHHDGRFKTTASKFVRKPEYQSRFEKSDWTVKQTV